MVKERGRKAEVVEDSGKDESVGKPINGRSDQRWGMDSGRCLKHNKQRLKVGYLHQIAEGRNPGSVSFSFLKKAIQVRYRLGISGNIKINELTKYQINQIEQMIGQDHVVHWELKRGEQADIERLISISCYRGIRHQDGSPVRGSHLTVVSNLISGLGSVRKSMAWAQSSQFGIKGLDIVSWVVNNFDCKRWCLNIHEKIVFVDEKEVESVLGIKSVTVDIIESLVKGNCDSALERELGLEIEHGMIVLLKIRERLIVMDSYEKEFIMKYVLFIMGKFLSPLMKSSVRKSMLSLLSSIERIRELNWSKFVLDSIVIGVRKWNKENKASVIGCVYVPAILCMERFYPVGEGMLPKTSRNLTKALNWD
ncbi:hypothetical protein M9H77_17019 [Catharanthus roseus]|uniref:Uncharacterized protein n=1 Tax=Catharanthus roseus TaxID=4058 RepID=A0ACC0B3F6_CATRO|nr:hypothetical protein M9H77_17019 [Catharanthus roseus]